MIVGLVDVSALTTAAARFCRCRRCRERNGGAATGEDAVMSSEVAEKIEMRREARVGQHAPGVAAHREDLAAFDEMMPVELERVGLLRHASLIDDRLAIILASRLKPIDLEQPVGRREELRLAELRPHRLVLDRDRPASHEPWIEEPSLLRHGDKVVPVERAAEALAIEQGIGLD